MKQLHIKYRPKDFSEVIGQKHITNSIQSVLDSNSNHAFLFTGPSGCGKTTLARIIASKVDCDSPMEIDAATNSGVDEMRTLTQGMQFKAFGKSQVKVIIIDECHMLSKSAWNSLLINIEQPPAHVYWIFCTTEPGKVPPTIKTRCVNYKVNPVEFGLLFGIVEKISHAEHLRIREDIVMLITDRAEGSPRQAIVYLEAVANCESLKEARLLLDLEESAKGVIDLCRYLNKSAIRWNELMALVNEFEIQDPETIRIMILRYFTKVAMNPNNERTRKNALSILETFATPFPITNKMASIVLALGEILVARQD